MKSDGCDNADEYNSCSLNSDCGCLLYSFSVTKGVCGSLTQTCSDFVPCQSPNDICPQSGYICVRHRRCHSLSLCYPLTMTQEDICPPKKGFHLTSNSRSF